MVRREYLSFRPRLIALLDKVDQTFFVSRPVEEDEPTGDYPTPLEAFHDEVLAKLEERRRATKGASTAEVCSFWNENDEREAADEDLRLRRTRKRLGVK